MVPHTGVEIHCLDKWKYLIIHIKYLILPVSESAFAKTGMDRSDNSGAGSGADPGANPEPDPDAGGYPPTKYT